MKRSRFLMFYFFGLTPQFLFGQMVSPLHQVMTSNSLIDRPSVFRDLQTEIKTLYGDVKPGIRLDAFYNKMSGKRSELLGKIQSPVVTFNAQKKTITITYGQTDYETQKIALKLSPNRCLDTLQSRMKAILKEELGAIFPAENNTERDAIVAALLTALRGAGVVRNVALGSSTDAYLESLADVIAGAIVERLGEEIQRSLPNIKFFVENEDVVAFLAQYQVPIQQRLDEVARRIKEKIAEALDMAEHEVAKVVDSYSKVLVAGNTGVAVTEGTGTFAGGVHVSFAFESSLQFGVYLNNQFGKADSGKTQPGTLFGVQARMADDCIQFEILTSRLAAPGQDPLNEFGFGLSLRLTNDFIAGVAVFSQLPAGLRIDMFDREDSKHVIGVFFKGASPESPSIMIGTSFQKGKSDTPVFQVSYPVVPSSR